MKKILFILALVFQSTFITAQNEDPWVEYMMPSSVHALLSQYTGSFTMEITMSMSDASPKTINVKSDHTMLLGGRFLEMKQQGTIMDMDYQSVMTIGFNNTDKKFSLTALTNSGTGTLSLSGQWNDQTKTATLFGQLTNPISKGVINVKQVVTFVDNNTILIESYDQEGDTPEKKTLQYKLVRNQ